MGGKQNARRTTINDSNGNKPEEEETQEQAEKTSEPTEEERGNFIRNRRISSENRGA